MCMYWHEHSKVNFGAVCREDLGGALSPHTPISGSEIMHHYYYYGVTYSSLLNMLMWDLAHVHGQGEDTTVHHFKLHTEGGAIKSSHDS